jgi:excisionase family DNA binding protein
MEKRVFELTVSEFMELLKQQQTPPASIIREVSNAPKMLYSIKELADFLQCSTGTAQKLKNSGRVPYMQSGRKVIFNGDEVLASMSNKKGGRS